MNSLLTRIKSLGSTVKISKEAKDFIAKKGFDSKFGARPLKRAIQKYFEDPLSEEIINAQVKDGDKILVSYSKKNGILKIKTQKPKVKIKK
jgi:ATP-dependent Clp protease ATP-binding subunit ClpC